METNSSILNRGVVGLDDCSALGKMSEIVIDCNTRSVGHLLITELDGKSKRALPFDKVINIGDTFIVIQSSKDLLEKKTVEEKKALSGFALLGCTVYSKAGDELGIIQSYEFDPVFGTITSIILDDESKFTADQFVFFSPELVFVHDGTELYAEMRAHGIDGPEEVDGEEEEATEAEPDPGESQLISYLIGTTINEDVKSEDGSFVIKKGTVLTEELVEQARSLDMLIALTMAVE